MKKIFSLLLVFTALCCHANGQSLSVYSPETTITGDSATLLASHAKVTNIGGGTIDVKARRTINNLANGHSSYFCFAGACYDPTISNSPLKATLNPMDVDSSFIGDLSPNNFPGTSYVTYCFYDNDNQGDSTCILFTYIATPTGLNELALFAIMSPASPNPSIDKTFIRFRLPSGYSASLIFADMLGNQIMTKSNIENNSVLEINTSELSAGVYFYSLALNNQILGSRKLIVTK